MAFLVCCIFGHGCYKTWKGQLLLVFSFGWFLLSRSIKNLFKYMYLETNLYVAFQTKNTSHKVKCIKVKYTELNLPNYVSRLKCFKKLWHITGIPWFTLLSNVETQKSVEAKLRKSRLLSSTKGEKNRIEL